nr:Uma2 family endonuclease [uncultured Thiodictyon sp.]
MSPRTAAGDHREKRDAYERAGVREYWLVHPTDRTLMVYRLVDGAYGRPEVQALIAETAVATIDGLCIIWPVAPAESAGAG